ncbi:MAG: hypothetical protein KAI33_06130, partial [Elusimicrobiales bacterium]|nr:hypothetical protein [Elusimicrobiales bacterium]
TTIGGTKVTNDMLTGSIAFTKLATTGSLGAAVTHKMGTGTGEGKPIGLANVNLTSAGTAADTAEHELITYALPADSLSANGKGIRVKIWGTTANNANVKTIKLYFGSTAHVSNDVTASPDNVHWEFEMMVFRTGSNAQDATGYGTLGSVLQSTKFAAYTETDTVAITIKVTGQSGTGTLNDIVAEGMIVEFIN